MVCRKLTRRRLQRARGRGRKKRRRANLQLPKPSVLRSVQSHAILRKYCFERNCVSSSSARCVSFKAGILVLVCASLCLNCKMVSKPDSMVLREFKRLLVDRSSWTSLEATRTVKEAFCSMLVCALDLIN